MLGMYFWQSLWLDKNERELMSDGGFYYIYKWIEI